MMTKVPLATTLALLAAATAVPLARQSPPAPAAQAPPAPAAQAPRPQTGDAQAPPTAFRAGIDVVSLNVTVTDSTGRYVTDLKQDEFLVFENGAKQNLTFFSRRDMPIALALLIDSSASMEYKLPTLQVAATNFVQRLKPGDVAEIVDFDERVMVRQAFTSNHADLVRAIHETSADKSTVLYNAIYFALKDLKKLQTAQATAGDEPRRQAIIVFSDGHDTNSLVSYDDVLDTAKRSDTAIYTIGLRDEQANAHGFRSEEFVLRQLAIETGGRAFFPRAIADLTSIYAQIADELSSQYSLGYTSSNQKRDGAWRPLVVQLTRPNLVTLTKKGYFAPSK